MTELPENAQTVETANKRKGKKPPTPGPSISVSRSVRELKSSLEKTAHGVASVADHFANSRKEPLLHKVWHSVKASALYLSIIMGSLFALEQYLASNYWEVNDRVEAQLLAASTALGDDDHIVQANAVRSLARISRFQTYEVSQGIKSIGQHIRAGIVGRAAFYPYFEDSWLVLRDFATSRNTSTSDLVSTQILREGAEIERRTRPGGEAPRNWSSGSLLFQAQLHGAIGKDLDLSGIQFGSANLEGSDLSGSNCSRCGMLGVRLDGAILRGTILDSAYLAESSIISADFSFARAHNAVFNKASLDNTNFLQADLSGAQFNAAKLSGAVFSQTDLAGADFTDAILSNCRFEQSDVSGADFRGADVEGADFRRAIGYSDALLADARNVDKAIIPKSSEALK